MSSEIAIKVKNLSKCYQIYAQPRDRLKQFFMPVVRKNAGLREVKYYKEFWALRSVSFDVKKGETIGIIGRNGSGKSTLLQMICGTLNPTGGTIETSGRIAALLELGSGFNPEFTGRENVYMNATVLGLAKDQIDARFEDIKVFADIGDFIEEPVKTYSSGMMLRLAFAVIAHVDADILVIDEALAVGDAFFTQKCMRFLRTFMKTGSVLFVTHDTAAIKNFCSFAIWLENGFVVDKGEPKIICEKYLASLYEERQGKSQLPKVKNKPNEIMLKENVDVRIKKINESILRNELKVFKFNLHNRSFGDGRAIISSAHFFNEAGDALSWVTGGERVSLTINATVVANINSPIIGFSVKDRLGQILFGDNTYLSNLDDPLICEEGDTISGTFVFMMPILQVGDYSIDVALASGTQEHHVQHHWIHDAINIKSESSSVTTGLVGIPMMHVNIALSKT